MKSLISALTFTSLALAACSSNEDTVSIDVRAISQAPGGDLSFADQSGTELKLTSALVHLRHIEIDLPDGQLCADIQAELEGATCDDAQKIRVPGPIVVDLVTGTSEPDLAAVAIAPGVYRRIDIRVDDGDPEEGLIEPGSPLDDYSLVVAAEFTYEGQPARLDLALNFDEDLRLETPAGVTVAPGANLAAELVIDDWMAGTDLAGCLASGEIALDAEGTLTIDDNADGACGGIEDIIKNNMKGSGQLD